MVYQQYSSEEFLHYYALIREILVSLREARIAIRELSWVITNYLYDQKQKEKIINRIKMLKETQFKLSFTVQDLRSNLIHTIGNEEERESIKKIFNSDDLIKELRKV